MNDLNEVASLFSSSPEEKIEAFEASTVKLILKQLGVSQFKINNLEFDNRLTSDVVMDALQGPHVWCTRVFKYNLEDFLLQSYKSEVVREFNKFREDNLQSHEQDFIMVFKAFSLGRLVMTNIDSFHSSGIRLPDYMWVVPFKNFFTDVFGADHDDNVII